MGENTQEQAVYYQLPEHHNSHLRKMTIGLAVFFTGLTVAVILIVIFAHQLAQLLPFSVEKQFVKPYETIAAKWFSAASGDENVKDYLQKLTNQLAKSMDMPEDYNLSVHYIDNDEANAFATLGGHVFMLKGTLKLVENENTLAMVLAHELAHIKHRDPVAAMGRGAAIQMLYTFVTGDSMADLSGELSLLFFSREQEAKADIAALHALQNHYGHVLGYDGFFKAIQDKYKLEDDIPEWLSSHPDLNARVSNLKQLADKHAYSLGQPTAIPPTIAATLATHKPSDLEQRLTQKPNNKKAE